MTALPNAPGAAVPGQCEGPRSIDSCVIWSRRSVSRPIFGMWIVPTTWIGLRTDGSGTSSGVRSVVSSGGGANSPGGGSGVVVVVVGPTARTRASTGARDAVRGSVPCGRCGSAADAEDTKNRSATVATTTKAVHHRRDVGPRRGDESVLELVESMISFGPSGPECAVSRAEDRHATVLLRRAFASASSGLRQGGARDPFVALANVDRASADSRGARESGRVGPTLGATHDVRLPGLFGPAPTAPCALHPVQPVDDIVRIVAES